jgi:hypothetical protein
MIGFDIEFEIFVQSEMAQESNDGLGIGVVLVIHGFHRLGLYQESTLEADTPAIVAG